MGGGVNALGDDAVAEQRPVHPPVQQDESFQLWEDFGYQFEADELEDLKRSIIEMALSRVEGEDELYVGGLWALRRSDSLSGKGITHVLSMIGFNPTTVKSFKEVPWAEYGRSYEHLVIDVNDVDDEDILIELPKAIKFIDQALRGDFAGDAAANLANGVDAINLSKHKHGQSQKRSKKRGIFVHCAAGKSRSATAVIAYLLWRYPERFDPNTAPISVADPCSVAVGSPQSSTAAGHGAAPRPRKDTAEEAVRAALAHVRRTRPMAEPNPGFMDQLALWWRMGCPDEVESHHLYQRWAYKREVEESTAVGQAPSRLRFEDEEVRSEDVAAEATQATPKVASLRCKKCRRTLATSPFFVDHRPSPMISHPDDSDDTSPQQQQPAPPPCQHVFVEPLSWMRDELEKGTLSGRLVCPNQRCGAGVGRYDWKGFKCTCGGWVVPALSLQRGRVDEVPAKPTVGEGAGPGGAAAARQQMGIRMPPGMKRDGGNL